MNFSLALYSIEQCEYSVIEPESGTKEFKFSILRQGNIALPSTVGKLLHDDKNIAILATQVVYREAPWPSG